MNPFYRDYIEGMTPEDWEFFAIDYLQYLYSFYLVSPPARGADGGKDAIVKKDKLTYIVSCKHYSIKNAISPSIEQSITDRITQHDADGFIGFYSTTVTQSLSDRFKKVGEKYPCHIFDIYGIYEDISLLPSYILSKYGLAKNIKYPFHVNNEDYQSLECLNCRKDILLDDNIPNSLVGTCIDRHNKLHYIYGCKRCLSNYINSYWGEISQVLHHEQLLVWNSIIEKQSKKHDLSCDFYKNKSTFDTRIQQRLVKMGTWI